MLLCIVVHDVELVSELRAIGLDLFPDSTERLLKRFPILLFEVVVRFKQNACRLNGVQLDFGVQGPFISDNRAFEEVLPDIIQIMAVRWLRSGRGNESPPKRRIQRGF